MNYLHKTLCVVLTLIVGQSVSLFAASSVGYAKKRSPITQFCHSRHAKGREVRLESLTDFLFFNKETNHDGTVSYLEQQYYRWFPHDEVAILQAILSGHLYTKDMADHLRKHLIYMARDHIKKSLMSDIITTLNAREEERNSLTSEQLVATVLDRVEQSDLISRKRKLMVQQALETLLSQKKEIRLNRRKIVSTVEEVLSEETWYASLLIEKVERGIQLTDKELQAYNNRCLRNLSVKMRNFGILLYNYYAQHASGELKNVYLYAAYQCFEYATDIRGSHDIIARYYQAYMLSQGIGVKKDAKRGKKILEEVQNGFDKMITKTNGLDLNGKQYGLLCYYYALSLLSSVPSQKIQEDSEYYASEAARCGVVLPVKSRKKTNRWFCWKR